MTPRQTLTYRLVRRHGYNPRDWQEAQIVEQEAARLVSTLSDKQVAYYLTRKVI